MAETLSYGNYTNMMKEVTDKEKEKKKKALEDRIKKKKKNLEYS